MRLMSISKKTETSRNPQTMNQLVVLRTFSSSIDVEIAKSYLESAGISCFLQDEIINRAYFANVNGGVKLLVREEELDEAIQILMDGGYLKKEDLEPSAEFGWVNKILNKFRKKSN